jgi:hypothetical protein
MQDTYIFGSTGRHANILSSSNGFELAEAYADCVNETSTPLNTTVNVSRSYIEEGNTSMFVNYNLSIKNNATIPLTGIVWNHTYSGVNHFDTAYENMSLDFTASQNRIIWEESLIPITVTATAYGSKPLFAGTGGNKRLNISTTFDQHVTIAFKVPVAGISQWLYKSTTNDDADAGTWVALTFTVLGSNIYRNLSDSDTLSSTSYMLSWSNLGAGGGGSGGGGFVFALVNETTNETTNETIIIAPPLTSMMPEGFFGWFSQFMSGLDNFLKQKQGIFPNIFLLGFGMIVIAVMDTSRKEKSGLATGLIGKMAVVSMVLLVVFYGQYLLVV